MLMKKVYYQIFIYLNKEMILNNILDKIDVVDFKIISFFFIMVWFLSFDLRLKISLSLQKL